ncbi:MAG TPA: hypothetical protein VFX93_07555 [Xanthomonadaceae bacterium]|nr:hypothetical protein [Xanthomonadaceae bacterium]
MNRPMLKLMAGALGAAVLALVLTLGGTAFAAPADLGAVDKQAVNPTAIPCLYNVDFASLFGKISNCVPH